jgi:hypothetical protein
MENVSNQIIIAMGGNIFNTSVLVNPQIISEVPFFKNLLLINVNNLEIFHGYINKILATWESILTDNFKNLIKEYNSMYIQYQYQLRVANEMVLDYRAQNLDLSGLSISPSISSLETGMSKSSISSKKPSKKKQNPKSSKTSDDVSSTAEDLSGLSLGRQHKITPYSF